MVLGGLPPMEAPISVLTLAEKNYQLCAGQGKKWWGGEATYHPGQQTLISRLGYFLANIPESAVSPALVTAYAMGHPFSLALPSLQSA